MLTICLDESGQFENKEYNKPLIIGGLVYKGEDFKEEEERIRKFYIDACKEIEIQIAKTFGRQISVSYPKDIHSTDNFSKVGREINRLLSEKVIKYIKKNDKYNITAMLKSNEMDESFCANKLLDGKGCVTSILDFNSGANLYERMATRFLYNNIFYNPSLKEQNSEVNLNLATRTITVQKGSKLYNQLMQLNYNNKENSNGSYRFYVTNSTTFKVALATKVYESVVNTNINYHLNVESINYYEEGTTPFLYLADSVCEIIKCEIYKLKNGLDTIQLIDIMKEKTGKDFFCFIYDDVDLIWTKLIEKIEEKNLIGALEKISEIKNSSCKHKKLYLEFWIPQIKQNLIEIFDKGMVESYLASLDYYFCKDNSEYERGMSIASELLTILEEKNLRNADYIRYRINEKIALAYNHKGAISKAFEHFQICEALKSKGVPLLEYLETINRKTVTLQNACDYEKSLENLNSQLPKYTKIKEAYFEIAVDMDIDSDTSYMINQEGKILSGIGQNLSYLKKYCEAEKYFTEAINVFSRDVDKAITRSYLIHMYLESMNKEDYENEIISILGTNNIEEQMNSIFKNPQKVDRYKLFIYIKALNTMYSSEVNVELVKKLTNLIKIMTDDMSFNQHPKEMIIKHLAQLAYKKNLKVEADKLMKEHIDKIEDSQFTINIIVEKAKIDYCQLKKADIHVNNKIEREKINKEIMKYIENIKEEILKESLTTEVFKELLTTDNNNVDKCIDLLNTRLTYMYN